MCTAVTLTHAHTYIAMLLAEEVPQSCPLPLFARLFKFEVGDGSYHKKTSNWHPQGDKRLGFFSLERGADGNRVLYPENNLLQQICIAMLRYECP